MVNKFSKLEAKLKIKFKNKNLLIQSFIHRSYLNENPPSVSGLLNHNERLEFLGDAVLELATTEYLYKKYPEKTEGEMTSLRAALVNAQMLAEISKELKLEDFLLLSKGEAKDTGKARQIILANTFEALVGAIYLDQGYKAVFSFLEKNVSPKLKEIISKKLWVDAKSLFQEKAQEIMGITPNYKVLKESGPDHAKNFVIGVFLDSEMAAQGEGFSKQEAEQNAARHALKTKRWLT
ncbi:MAG: ribonuclease III [Patescibacteria group bacterium]